MRFCRLERGWTEAELAQRLGYSAWQIIRWENGTGRIGAARLFELAEYLGVYPSYFFDNLAAPRSNLH